MNIYLILFGAGTWTPLSSLYFTILKIISYHIIYFFTITFTLG